MKYRRIVRRTSQLILRHQSYKVHVCDIDIHRECGVSVTPRGHISGYARNPFPTTTGVLNSVETDCSCEKNTFSF